MPAFPMFPLGSVLFPHALLPLHVFEPRYRQLTEECLAGDRAFGVVLIERGSEVGGGDVRFDVGTVARILRAGRLDDGRWIMVTTGAERLRVREWLPDEPYPRAEVEHLPDRVGPSASPKVDLASSRLRRVLGLRAELGDPAAALDVAPADDPVRASFELAAASALSPLDAQRLLELDDAEERLDRLIALLDEESDMLELRLAGG